MQEFAVRFGVAWGVAAKTATPYQLLGHPLRFNRAIHTGDLLGTAGHVIVSLSSLLLVVMVLTGAVIWLKKLAV